jgi:hypothetical protein
MSTISLYSHLTSRQFAEQILDSLERDLDVDLRPIFYDNSRSEEQRRHAVSARLMEAILARAENSPDRAEWASDAEENHKFLSAVGAGEVDVEPNLTYTTENVDTLKDFRGDQIKDYLYSLTKRFENMSKVTNPAILAAQIVGGGMVSISIPMAVGTIQALRAGQTLLAAVRAGIANIGMKTVILAVVIILASLLIWLFLENPKKLLGLVLNDTDSNLVVNDWRKGVDGDTGGDLYMKHGSMVSFPLDYENGNLKKPLQISKRDLVVGKPDESLVYGGIYFANKNFGGYGAEGVAIYSAQNGTAKFAQLFACPYSEDNGTTVRVMNGGTTDLPKLYNEMYKTRKVHDVTKSGAFTLSSTVNDSSGGVVGCIACFSQA